MIDRINALLQEVEAFKAADFASVEAARIEWLGRKGVITELFDTFKTLGPNEKKQLGAALNTLKNNAQNKIEQLKLSVKPISTNTALEDFSMPAVPFIKSGSRHPLSLVKHDIIGIFSQLGFTVSEGPEIEDDWHNFTALNTPIDHPARDMQDTFYIDHPQEYVLRTQTSSVQVRLMEQQQPPIRTLSPGRVYRNEAISARAHCQFHQIEGLYVDDKVSFADLKQTLSHFIHQFFGSQTKIRMRPSYFPFTEPSAEVDVSCTLCSGKGCNVCKHSGWLEVMGCGMVDPQVFENCGIDAKRYSGFAFGMGIERLAMLKFGIKDLRLFFENDLRFLNQFRRS
ncbi:MAG: phenylalanine--tRNA ligase subunit alpha [Bacteroidia bacterium]